jgi:hypothetical protein
MEIKYDYAFKLECVKLVIDKLSAMNYLMKGISEQSNVRRWVGFYRNLWYNWIVTKEKSIYSIDFNSSTFIIKDLLSLRATV